MVLHTRMLYTIYHVNIACHSLHFILGDWYQYSPSKISLKKTRCLIPSHISQELQRVCAAAQRDEYPPDLLSSTAPAAHPPVFCSPPTHRRSHYKEHPAAAQHPHGHLCGGVFLWHKGPVLAPGRALRVREPGAVLRRQRCFSQHLRHAHVVGLLRAGARRLCRAAGRDAAPKHQDGAADECHGLAEDPRHPGGRRPRKESDLVLVDHILLVRDVIFRRLVHPPSVRLRPRVLLQLIPEVRAVPRWHLLRHRQAELLRALRKGRVFVVGWSCVVLAVVEERNRSAGLERGRASEHGGRAVGGAG